MKQPKPKVPKIPGPPAGYEAGQPAMEVTIKQSYYPKPPKPPGKPVRAVQAAKPKKPDPIDVMIVGMKPGLKLRPVK